MNSKLKLFVSATFFFSCKKGFLSLMQTLFQFTFECDISTGSVEIKIWRKIANQKETLIKVLAILSQSLNMLGKVQEMSKTRENAHF